MDTGNSSAALANGIVISDSYKGISRNELLIPDHYRDEIEHILIPSGLVRDRTRKLAKDITEVFRNEPFLALCVLKGAYRFFSEILEEMKAFHTQPIAIDFIRLKSYENIQSSEIKVE